MSDLSVKLGSLKLKNPVLLSSGTAGYGDDNPSAKAVGALITKGLSIRPRDGNPPPRIWETPSGVLNSIGLENEGVQEFLNSRMPGIRKLKIDIIANIFGETVDDYVAVTKRLSGEPGVAAIEVNVSCPNVKKGGLSFASSAENLFELIQAVREEVSSLLIVKLPPVGNVIGLAQSAVDAGADVISLINAYPGMVVDTKNKRPVFKMGGGLAGPAIRPIALRKVWDLVGEVDVPVIGGGGIQSLDDLLQFLMAGATAVSIGSSAMVSPFLPKKIIGELESYMEREGVKHVGEIIGAAR